MPDCTIRNHLVCAEHLQQINRAGLADPQPPALSPTDEGSVTRTRLLQPACLQHQVCLVSLVAKTGRNIFL